MLEVVVIVGKLKKTMDYQLKKRMDCLRALALKELK